MAASSPPWSGWALFFASFVAGPVYTRRDCFLHRPFGGSGGGKLLIRTVPETVEARVRGLVYTVNPATGKATLVGVTGIPAVPFVPASTNPNGSFNFYDENLFGLEGKLYANFDAATFDPATSVFTTVIPPALYQIDANTGHASKIAPTDLGLITIFDLNGMIYGFSGATNQVVTLDVTNGTTNFVSNIDASGGLIGGAAPAVPEPASIALVGVGIASIIFCRRQRRHL